MGQSIRFCQCRPSISFIFLVLVMLSTVVTFGQTSDDGKPDEARKPAAPKLEVLNELFSASKVEILEDGRVRLTYDFETKEDELLQDWTPDISTTRNRIRWSRGYEGTFSTVEDGLVIADEGIFLHKGFWKDNVKVEVSYLSMANTGKNDLIAAVFAYDKGRRVVGSNMGSQCVRLSNKLKHKGAPIPRQLSSPLVSSRKSTFSMELKDCVLHARRGK